MASLLVPLLSSPHFAGFSCTTAYTYCNTQLTTPYYNTGLNPYDIRKECGDNPLCYDFSNVEKWLTTDSTREALHVTDVSATWVSCNNNVNAEFRNDWMINYDSYIADMLEGDIDILIYAGDVDFICNSLGNKAWTLNLEWSGKEAFNALEDKDWENGSGSVRTYNGLTFLTVFDAGHMVPSDKPKAALIMLDTFTQGKELLLGETSNPTVGKPDPVHPIQCAADMAKIAEDVASGKKVINDIESDCTAPGDACNADLLAFMSLVDATLDHATAAAENCLDGSDSACNQDVETIISVLEDVSTDVEALLVACPGKKIKECIEDVKDFGGVVEKAVKDVTAAVKDCKA